MSDWTDDFLSISEFCDTSQPLQTYQPSEEVRKARSRASINKSFLEDDQVRKPARPIGRGFACKCRRIEKVVGGPSAFLAQQDLTTISIRQVCGTYDESLESLLKADPNSGGESSSSSQYSTNLDKDGNETARPLSELLKACKKPVRGIAPSVNESEAVVTVAVVNNTSPTPSIDEENNNINNEEPKPNIHSLKDFPAL